MGMVPRPSGMNSHNSAVPLGIQVHGDPIAPFSTAPVSARASPVAGSAIHSSRPPGAAFTNARCDPSGENDTPESLAPSGTCTGTVAPVSMS